MPVQSAIGGQLESPLGSVFEPWYKDPQYIGGGIIPSMIFNPAQNQYAKASTPNGPLIPTTLKGFLEGFSRSGDTATRINAAGVIENVLANQPRITHDPVTLQPLGLLVEDSRTNYIRNGNGVGASSPNTLPTNWSVSTSRGLTTQVVGTGTSRGVSYVDLRISGTPTTTGNYAIAFETGTAIPALNAQMWTYSSWLALVSGSLTNIGSVGFTADENNAAGTYVAGGATIANISGELTSTIQRFAQSRTNTNANTAYVRPFFVFAVTSGQAVDVTFRVGFAQAEIGAVSSYIPTTGSTVTRAADEPFTNDMTWFNPNEGTIIVRSISGVGTGSVSVGLGNTTGSGRAQIANSNTEQGFFGVDDAGNTRTVKTTTGLSSGVDTKVGVTYAANYNAAFGNGVKLAQSTLTWTTLTPTMLSVGRRYAGGLAAQYLNAPIAYILYYPKRLTDAEIQRLTTL